MCCVCVCLSIPYLGISLNLKVVITQVTLHSKLEDWSGVVVTHLTLLGIVPHPHPHVSTTPPTPNVIGELKTDHHDPLVQLPGPLSQRVGPMEGVQRALDRENRMVSIIQYQNFQSIKVY